MLEAADSKKQIAADKERVGMTAWKHYKLTTFNKQNDTAKMKRTTKTRK